MIKLFLTSLVIALLGLTAPAQQKSEPCKMSNYVNRNQLDPRPLSVTKLLGRVMVEVGELGGSTRETGPASGACLGLFTEREHQLVAIVSADKEGRFAFDAVPEGEYRLIVRADPLCLANVPLRVVRSQRGGTRKKQVVVHMRAAGIDTCSYADYR